MPISTMRSFGAVLVTSWLSVGAVQAQGPMAMTFDFQTMDANSDGMISQDEMSTFQSHRMLGMDADKDGYVTGAEMTNAMAARLTSKMGEMVEKRIGALDSDHDGKLSTAEISASPRVGKIFARMDANGDDSLSPEELTAAKARMKEMRAKRRAAGGDDGMTDTCPTL